jgi:hypothetical protein
MTSGFSSDRDSHSSTLQTINVKLTITKWLDAPSTLLQFGPQVRGLRLAPGHGDGRLGVRPDVVGKANENATLRLHFQDRPVVRRLCEWRPLHRYWPRNWLELAEQEPERERPELAPQQSERREIAARESEPDRSVAVRQERMALDRATHLDWVRIGHAGTTPSAEGRGHPAAQ